MATHRTVKLPFSRIIKIGIWSNQSAKTTMANIYSKLQSKYPGKEIYIQNAGFFSMTSAMPPCWGLKADNKVYGDGWSSTCFMAMRNNEIRFYPSGSTFPAGYTDGVSGYPALIENGKKSSAYHEAPDGKSDRGRTMIGYNAGYLIMSCIADTTGTSDFTLKEELDYMLKQGCTFAVNLDGGGSSQCNFNGSKITSSRKVNNFIYAIVEPENADYKAQVQLWLNSTYNAKLVVDKCLGNLTLQAIIKAMQKECCVEADGSWGRLSQNAYKAIGYGYKTNTVNKVKIIQCALCRKGYWNADIYGQFTETLKNQVILFQRANKLAVDGVVGPATIKALFK